MALKRKYGLNGFISLNASFKFYTGVCNLIHLSDEKKGSTPETEETPEAPEEVEEAPKTDAEPSDEEATEDKAPEGDTKAE